MSTRSPTRPAPSSSGKASRSAPGEITRFLQQSASSAVLNRDHRPGPVADPGRAAVERQGVPDQPQRRVFGADSRVDVNGLVASSLALSNERFPGRQDELHAPAPPRAGVANQGRITTPGGGKVYLIAPNVSNSGVIHRAGRRRGAGRRPQRAAGRLQQPRPARGGERAAGPGHQPGPGDGRRAARSASTARWSTSAAWSTPTARGSAPTARSCSRPAATCCWTPAA